MKIEHIGYLVNSIEKTSGSFRVLGYAAGEIFRDDTQKTRICFLTKGGDVKIELVEPYPDNETMLRLQKKMGVSPYHVCYSTENIEREYQRLIEDGFIPLFKPVNAVAFGGRRICYLWMKTTGYIEIVEQ